MFHAQMRTTLTIDDGIARDLKEIARRSGKSFKVVVNEILRAGLDAAKSGPRPHRYRVKPESLGDPLPGIDLDKALSLADRLEENEIAQKLGLRK